MADSLDSGLCRFTAPTYPTSADWATFKDLIVKLYRDDSWSLKDVQRHLQETFNFIATPRMFKRQLEKWDVHKNLRSKDVASICEQITEYQNTHNKSPDHLEINGRKVEAHRAKRALRRHELRNQLNASQSDGLEDVEVVASQVSPEMPPCSASDEVAASQDHLIVNEASDLDLSFRLLSNDDRTNSSLARPLSYQQDLSVHELGALSVAMLQTDFHLAQVLSRSSTALAYTLHEEPTATASSSPGQPRESIEESDNIPDESLIPADNPDKITDRMHNPNSSLRIRDKIRDMKFAFEATGNFYSVLASQNQRHCANTTAHDFYGRLWLGIEYEAIVPQTSDHAAMAGWLFSTAWESADEASSRDRAHLLPILCLVACAPSKSKACLLFANIDAAMDRRCSYYASDSPEYDLSVILSKSQFRRDIALVLLRVIIGEFREKTDDRYMEELNILSRPLDGVIWHEKSTREEIDSLLTKWARAGYSVAEVIAEDGRRSSQRQRSTNKDPFCFFQSF